MWFQKDRDKNIAIQTDSVVQPRQTKARIVQKEHGVGKFHSGSNFRESDCCGTTGASRTSHSMACNQHILQDNRWAFKRFILVHIDIFLVLPRAKYSGFGSIMTPTNSPKCFGHLFSSLAWA